MKNPFESKSTVDLIARLITEDNDIVIDGIQSELAHRKGETNSHPFLESAPMSDLLKIEKSTNPEEAYVAHREINSRMDRYPQGVSPFLIPKLVA